MVHAHALSDLRELVQALPQPERNQVLRTVKCFKRSFFRLMA